jgi:hypothetical protein
MTKPDLALSQIAARFTRHDVEWSRGAFMIIDRRTRCFAIRAADKPVQNWPKSS